MTLVAGVDSSTQSCKVVIVDAQTGREVRSGRASHPAGTAVNPEAWWDALLVAVADAGGLDDVAAISIGGQQHGCVALDADGAVIRDALLWNDTRSAAAALDLRAEIGDEQWAARTGSVPVASFTVTKLRWMRDAEPANASRVAAVALPHDWLTWRLRGYGPSGALGADLSALTTDRSDASGTGYWSPHTGEYDRDLLVRALGHDAVLPRVAEPGETVGVTAAVAGTIPTGIAVAVGAGDNAAAALGLGAQHGDVIVSIGTSGTAFASVAHHMADSTGTIAGFADASGGFLPLVATMNAAQVVGTFASLLGVNFDEFGELAEQAESAESPVLLPFLAGERTPNLPDARASLRGLSLANTTRAGIARAAIEGMVCGLAAGVAAIADQGVSFDRVILIGGGGKLRATRSAMARVLGLAIAVAPEAEYVARGAALQAARIALGTDVSWPLDDVIVHTEPHDPAILERYNRALADYRTTGGAG
ncbi:xylulokinase [Microbacterium sp. NC79]|uniref:xylulokinase n=1 Tax=Microbacterium sp. NC79 TaxID=2851009 RepID=UPI001C2B9A62|nr:xylulokinase [Microbacterium sp. NC79]MBV0896006.1 xylulokinase [Microbacterium sp. NC79]